MVQSTVAIQYYSTATTTVYTVQWCSVTTVQYYGVVTELTDGHTTLFSITTFQKMTDVH